MKSVKKLLNKINNHISNGTLHRVAFNYLKKPYRKFNKQYPLLFQRDLYNKLKYGLKAPIIHERIWVDPKDVKTMLKPSEVKRITGLTRKYASGFVIDWDEVERTRPVKGEFKFQYCVKHWVEGVSWEELGVIEFLKKNSKKHRRKTEEELIERFKMLDEAFEEIKKEGRLKTMKELNPDNYREYDGILIHIGKDGEPFFGSCGNHRLAMAIILGFEKIPAWIGLVDKDSIKYLDMYREPPESEKNKM